MDTIQTKQLLWYRHLERMDDIRWSKKYGTEILLKEENEADPLGFGEMTLWKPWQLKVFKKETEMTENAEN